MLSVRVRAFIGTAATIGLAAVIVSCGGGGGGDSTPAPAPVTAPSTTIVRSATLNAAQETTGSRSTATGQGGVIVNTTTGAISGGITFSGMTASAAHIHKAAAGVDGSVIIPLTLSPDGTAATIPAGMLLTAGEITDLQAGNLYFNVHSTNNLLCGPVAAPTNCAGGEIRGQITGTTNLIGGLATLNAAQETTGSTSAATGRGTIVVDSVTRQILIAYATHNVANPTNAHIHLGAPGVAGGVDTGLNAATTAIPHAPQGATLAAASVTALNAGNLYFNIHSNNPLCGPPAGSSCAVGEIRGAIGVVQ